MSRKTIMPLLLFVILAWGGSAGIAYGIIQSVEGPQGPPGPQGEQGPKGESAASGFSDFSTSLALKRLAEMWAVNVYAQHNPGEAIAGSHPGVRACVDYIMDGTGSFVECGFERTD